jgi:hypothetical protein
MLWHSEKSIPIKPSKKLSNMPKIEGGAIRPQVTLPMRGEGCCAMRKPERGAVCRCGLPLKMLKTMPNR